MPSQIHRQAMLLSNGRRPRQVCVRTRKDSLDPHMDEGRESPFPPPSSHCRSIEARERREPVSPPSKPANFESVTGDLIYRSSFPTAKTFPFLATLRLKTIVTLVSNDIWSDDMPPEYAAFMAAQGIRHVVAPVPPNDGAALDLRHRGILDALAVVVRPANWPLLVHCSKGTHRTGCVVGVLRRAQGMDLDELLAEYYDCAGTMARELDEEFITTFPPALVGLVARVGGYVDDPVIYHDVQED